MITQAHVLPPPELQTLRDFVRWGASAFTRAKLVFAHGTDNALDEAFHLVLHALHLGGDLPAVYLECALTQDERCAVFELLSQRIATRKPAAYLIGSIQFCGLPFLVNEQVLVPRSPIGELIEQRFSPWVHNAPKRILDLCAGSGCIGIACLLAFPEAQVDLAEWSLDALAVCQQNIDRHECQSQVRAVHSDLFTSLNQQRYDLIVTNPPYVPNAEVDALAPEFGHEPRMALAAGDDGMDIVERILQDAPQYLNDHGLLICEIGGSRPEFEARFPGIPVAWPDFTKGGDGVFVIGKIELKKWLKTR